MKDINSLAPRRQIDHPKSTGCIAHANLFDARAHILHWFPIQWVQAALHEVQVEAGVPTRLVRKRSQVLETGPEEMQRLACNRHRPVIQVLGYLYKYLYSDLGTYRLHARARDAKNALKRAAANAGGLVVLTRYACGKNPPPSDDLGAGNLAGNSGSDFLTL